MKKNMGLHAALRWLNNYVVFFLLVAFVITCCMLLFVTTLSDSLNVELTGENLGAAAKLTFLNVVLLSLIFSVIDALRRRYTVEKPVQHITEAAEKMIRGDFSVRISPPNSFVRDATFNRIIDCFNKMAE